MSPGEECVFCAIVAGTARSAPVYEDARTLAFIPLAPATEGHALVIPKRHSRNILDVGDEDLAAVALTTREIARRQRERLRCDGVSIFQANEPAGFQTVFHYHVHVVPRYPEDRVSEAWHATNVDFATIEAMAARLR